MKTSIVSKVAGAGLGLLFSAVISTNAVAGPGSQYWQAQGKPKAVEASKPDAAPVTLCVDAKVVSDTIMKPMMANGKGPLGPVQIGTKTVCHICPVTTTVARNSLPNGKGVPTTTQLTKTGVEHNCAKCTGTPTKA
jgi:hypothetical protein